MDNIINKINYNDCCEVTSDVNIYIKDINNSSCIISNEDDYHVHVINKKNKDISFLKIDKCVYNDGDDKKCDFAVADDDIAYFVEVKELENFDSHSKRNSKRKEAKRQLINTIKLFIDKYPEIDTLKISAVIALLPKLEEGYISVINIKTQTVIDEFIEKCGCPNIYEGNQIEFK